MPETKINQNPYTTDEFVLNPGQLTRQAIKETALEIGGDELVQEVVAKFSQEELLADEVALQHLEDIQPGTKLQVIERADQKQQEVHEQDIANQSNCTLRQLGSLVLNIFKR